MVEEEAIVVVVIQVHLIQVVLHIQVAVHHTQVALVIQIAHLVIQEAVQGMMDQVHHIRVAQLVTMQGVRVLMLTAQVVIQIQKYPSQVLILMIQQGRLDRLTHTHEQVNTTHDKIAPQHH